MIQNGILKIVLPNKKSIDVVNSIATETGDIGALSDVDINILALGLQLKKICTQNNVPIVITDDYSIQNLASRLGLKFKSLLTPGIKQKILWIIYCPGCHNTYENTDTKICVMCGTELKRKPVSKTKIKMGRLSI